MSAELHDFQFVHSLLRKMNEEMAGGPIPVPAEIERMIGGGEIDPQMAARWLWLLDAGIGPDRFRRAIEKLQPRPVEYEALVRYFARKRPLREEDIERLEWLVTYLFRNPVTSGGHGSSSEMLRDIQMWLGGEREALSGIAEALMAELVEVLEDVVACRMFKELAHSGLLSRGRGVKQRFRDEFVHAEVLAAVVNYNLVSGRKFQQLLAAAAGDSEFPADLAEKEYRSAAEEFRRWNGAAPAAIKPASTTSEASAARPPAPTMLSRKISALGIDPGMEEGRLRSMTNELVAFARAAGPTISEFPLPNSVLRLSSWEVQALMVDYPGTEKSFRANFNRAVRRAVSLLAVMQEETILHDVKRHSEHYWKKHVDTLFYTLYSGDENITEMDALAQDAAARGLEEKAAQLSQTLAHMRLRMQQVAELCRHWKDTDGASLQAYGGFVPQMISR